MKVYKIECFINGKIYVGQTQRPLEERISEHKRADSLIGRAIRHYGLDNFKIEVIAECDNIDELNELEKFWIAKLNCKAPNGYNLTDGGFGVVGYKRKSISETARRNMSAAHAKRSILCIEKGIEFESITAAAKWCNGHTENISRACRGIKLTASGFHWKYAEKQVELVEHKGRKTRAVYCIETKTFYESIKYAAENNNCDTARIVRACQNINKTAAGYHWCYYEDLEKIKIEELSIPKKKKVVRCIETNEIFPSIRCAAKVYGVDHSQIVRACKGEQKTAAGYHWEIA